MGVVRQVVVSKWRPAVYVDNIIGESTAADLDREPVKACCSRHIASPARRVRECRKPITT